MINFFILSEGFVWKRSSKARVVTSKSDVNSNVMTQFIVVNVSTFIKFYANKILTLHSFILSEGFVCKRTSSVCLQANPMLVLT